MKKKKILTIIFVILVILFVSVILLVVTNKQTDSTENQLDDVRVKELIKNSYIYYQLYNGEIPLGKDIYFDGDTEYIKVDLDISNPTDLENLIKDNVVDGRWEILLDQLLNNDTRNYIYFNNQLYVNVSEDDIVCKLPYPIDLESNYKITKVDKDTAIIDYYYTGVYVKRENDKWLLEDFLISCDLDEAIVDN